MIVELLYCYVARLALTVLYCCPVWRISSLLQQGLLGRTQESKVLTAISCNP